MQSALYVGLSAQVALERRLTTLANNIANMNTGGYRAEGVSFQSLLSKVAATPVSFVTAGNTYLSRAAGDVVRTDNPLDVAVQGNAWLAIRTPQGVVYTRDGRMRIAQSGELQTLNGYPVLDAGNSTIILDPTAGAPTIAGDGMITQGGHQVGALGLFSIDDAARLTRFGNSGVVSDRPAAAVLDFSTNGVLQGFSEGSNVNPVIEMTKLVMLTRAFDTVATTTQQSESSLQDAIKTLGPGT